MNIKLFTIIVIILVSSSLHAEDMHQFMRDTRDLVEEGEYQQALERTIWFHNNVLDHSPSMNGVRLSFALSDWYKLAQLYTPALNSLNDVRRESEHAVLSGNVDFDAFSEYASINRVFSEDHKTIAFFKQIELEDKKKAQEYWRLVQDAAIDLKEYELLRRHIGNVYREYKMVEERFLEYIGSDLVEFAKYREALISTHENMFVKEVLDLIDIALAINDKESAIKYLTTRKSM